MKIFERKPPDSRILPLSSIWVVCIICLLSGCKSLKTAESSSNAILKTEEAFFSSVIDNSLRFNTLSARLKLELTTPGKELSSRATLKMRNNEVIQISVQPFLGIEAFKIELTGDSVKIIDRFNKRYILESYDNLKGKTAVDFNFNNLQALFTNKIFLPGHNELTTKQFSNFRYARDSERKAEFMTEDATGLIYRFVADGSEKLLSTVIEQNTEKNMLKWLYDDFQNIDNQKFPMKMTASLTGDEEEHGSVTLLLSDPELNKPITTDFKIPSGYERVTLSQILKMLELK
ncbi:MAG: DUF4292 domain-containing protein [Tannerella sp.]|nr:DUF4292 domain-containing protein [Tannerella sp.]